MREKRKKNDQENATDDHTLKASREQNKERAFLFSSNRLSQT